MHRFGALQGKAEGSRSETAAPGPLEPSAAVYGLRCRMGQWIQGAVYVPVSWRIAVQSSPAQMFLILPWYRR
jgi:hypothetical protein